MIKEDNPMRVPALGIPSLCGDERTLIRAGLGS